MKNIYMKKIFMTPPNRNRATSGRRFSTIRLLLSVLLLIATPQKARCQDSSKIEADFSENMKSNPSTAGMMEAIQNAQAEWDKIINKKLENLKQKLKPEQWAVAEASQKNWLAYLNSEIKLIVLAYGRHDASEYKIESSMMIMELYKSRAKMLDKYEIVMNE